MNPYPNLAKHPIHFLEFLRKHDGADGTKLQMKIQFVTYEYDGGKGYGKHDTAPNDREYFEVPLAIVSDRWLAGVLAHLPADRTFGFTGRVFIEQPSALGTPSRNEFFVPVLDLKGTECPPQEAINFHFDLGGSDLDGSETEMALYETDKSFHIYIAKLLPIADLQHFLADALLFNETQKRGKKKDDLIEVIDTRWVGHSLRRGAATVRWSRKNQDAENSKPPFLSDRWPLPSFFSLWAGPLRNSEEAMDSLREAVEGR